MIKGGRFERHCASRRIGLIVRATGCRFEPTRGVVGPGCQIPQIAPRELADMRGDHVPVVVDVRADNEWNEGHLPAAIHIPLGRLTERLSELPQQQPLLVQCAAGTRSAIAASVLTRAGVTDVSNLVGGYNAWAAAGLPTTA